MKNMVDTRFSVVNFDELIRLRNAEGACEGYFCVFCEMFTETAN